MGPAITPSPHPCGDDMHASAFASVACSARSTEWRGSRSSGSRLTSGGAYGASGEDSLLPASSLRTLRAPPLAASCGPESFRDPEDEGRPSTDAPHLGVGV